MNGFARKALLTFLIGGVTGVVGQALVMGYEAAGLDGLALPMAVLSTLGIVGCLMVVTRVADRLLGTGASVSLIAFFGLSIAMAEAYRGMRCDGMSVWKAFLGTWKFFAVALIPGIIIAVLVGLLCGFVGIA